MFHRVDQFLNGVAMYRLLTYVLSLLVIVAFVFSLTGQIGQPTIPLAVSLTILLTAGYVTNLLFGKIWRVPTNTDSGLITTLILFFILPPPSSVIEAIGMALAGVVAMASKFIVAYHGKHLFNPAAFTVVLLGLVGVLHSNWWVGSSAMWPFVLVLGLVTLRKVRRVQVFAIFAAVSVVVTLLVGNSRGLSILQSLDLLLTASPLIFLGTIMLTEPATMPSKRTQQLMFAAIVGVLYAWQLDVQGFYVYPETALIIGNLYAFSVNARRRWQLQLVRKERISDQVYNYVFKPDAPVNFSPGQYMEWTLPLAKSDNRGNRRTFTIASSPAEGEVHLGVKFYSPASRFKQAMYSMKPGQTLFAGHVGGNFTLPNNSKQKLLFIAGGIGITPFRSMIQHLVDTNQTRDITLLYAVSNEVELAYRELLVRAQNYGVTVIELVGKDALNGSVIINNVPDLADRKVYISGPFNMVTAAKKMLRQLGVARRAVKTDFFCGY